jgi:arsenite methyltransferase
MFNFLCMFSVSRSIFTLNATSYLVADRGISKDSLDPEKWCSCIDGALTNVEVLEEKAYIDDQADNDDRQISMKISSLIIKAVKG